MALPTNIGEMQSLGNSDIATEGRSNAEQELQAFNSIVSAVGSLQGESRGRVISSALTFLGWDRQHAHLLQRDISVREVASHAASKPFSEDRTPTAKEFMLEKRPVTDVERVVALAYYLTHYRETPHFKTLDLSKLNTEAAQIKFSNAAKAVDNASSAGLLVQAGKGNKQISAVGEMYVQALPDRAAAKEAIAHARPRRKTRRGIGRVERMSDETTN